MVKTFQKLIGYYVLQKNRIHRLLIEGSWILTGQVITVLGSLVLVRVLTEYLDPEEYGQLALGLTVATLVNQVIIGGFIAGIGRFYSIAVEKRDFWGYLQASCQTLAIGAVFVVSLGVILSGILVAAHIQDWLWLVVAALVFSLFSGINSALSAIQNAARQRAIVALHGGMDAWLKIGLALGIMLWLGKNSTVVISGYALSTIIVTLSQLFFLKRLIGIHSKTDYQETKDDWVKRIFVFGRPMMVAGLFNWGYYASQRWALELFASTDEVGKFYALTQIAYTPTALAGSLIMTFITPIIYARVGDPGNYVRVIAARNLIFKIAGVGLGMSLLGASIVSFYHEWIFGILVAQQYRDASPYMPLIFLAAGILQTSHCMSIYIAAQNKTYLFIWLGVICNSIIILSNLYFTSVFGMAGLIISMVGGATFHLVWMLCIAKISSAALLNSSN